MSKINVDTWEPESGTAATLMASGDTVTVPSGATLAVASGATVTNSGTASGFGLFSSYAIIADQKAQDTEGGTFTSGAWRERDLQTEIADPDGIVSISTNQFTLGAGTYLIKWSAPGYKVNNHVTRLYNVTDTSVVEGGCCAYCQTAEAVETRSDGSARTTIAGSKAFTIEHQASATSATYGFGVYAGMSTEQYTLVEIFKEA